MLLGLSLSLFELLVMKKKWEWREKGEEECKRCGNPWRERERERVKS